MISRRDDEDEERAEGAAHERCEASEVAPVPRAGPLRVRLGARHEGADGLRERGCARASTEALGRRPVRQGQERRAAPARNSRRLGRRSGTSTGGASPWPRRRARRSPSATTSESSALGSPRQARLKPHSSGMLVGAEHDVVGGDAGVRDPEVMEPRHGLGHRRDQVRRREHRDPADRREGVVPGPGHPQLRPFVVGVEAEQLDHARHRGRRRAPRPRGRGGRRPVRDRLA